MDINEYHTLFSSFRLSAFRLETLSAYNVEAEREAFTAFLAGTPLPDIPPHTSWLDFISEAKSAGKHITRVHLMPVVLTPYLRFQIEWGYYYSYKAGEEIRILLPEKDKTEAHVKSGDFWVFDDETFVSLNYTSDGTFLGVTKISEIDKAVYRSIRDSALERSIPFTEYLSLLRS